MSDHRRHPRPRPPFSPEASRRVRRALKLYRITKITGDHFGGEFVKEPFRRHGLSYELCKQPKSDLFRDMLPLLNAATSPCRGTIASSPRSSVWSGGCRAPAETASITRRAHTMILRMLLRVSPRCSPPQSRMIRRWTGSAGRMPMHGTLGRPCACGITSEGMGNSVRRLSPRARFGYGDVLHQIGAAGITDRQNWRKKEQPCILLISTGHH